MEKEILEKLDALSLNVEDIFKYISSMEDKDIDLTPIQDAVSELNAVSDSIQSFSDVSEKMTAYFDSIEGSDETVMYEVSDTLTELSSKITDFISSVDNSSITSELSLLGEKLSDITEQRENQEVSVSFEDVKVIVDDIKDAVGNIQILPDIDIEPLMATLESIEFNKTINIDTELDYEKLDEIKESLNSLTADINTSVNIEPNISLDEIISEVESLKDYISEDIDISSIQDALESLNTISLGEFDTAINTSYQNAVESLRAIKDEIENIKVEYDNVDVNFSYPYLENPEIDIQPKIEIIQEPGQQQEIIPEIQVVEIYRDETEQEFKPEYIRTEVNTSVLEEKLDTNNNLLIALADAIKNIKQDSTVSSSTVVEKTNTENIVSISSEENKNTYNEQMLVLLAEISSKLSNMKPKKGFTFDTKTNFD